MEIIPYKPITKQVGDHTLFYGEQSHYILKNRREDMKLTQ